MPIEIHSVNHNGSKKILAGKTLDDKDEFYFLQNQQIFLGWEKMVRESKKK